MESIKTVDQLSARLGSLSLIDFTIVDHLILTSADAERTRYDLELALATDKQVDNRKIVLKFHRVASLRIKAFGGGLTQIIGLDLSNIRDRGWEHLHWEISDFENGVIAFYCEAVSLVLFEPVT